MKYLVFIFLLNWSLANAESFYGQDCSGSSGISMGESVFLTIDTAFSGQTVFQLRKIDWEIQREGKQSEREIDYSLIVKNTSMVTNNEQRKSTLTTTCDNLKISNTEYEKILNLFTDALKVNLFDRVMGLDGSTWCVEITGLAVQERKFCFWSPEYEPKKRGLQGLVNLEDYLSKFVKSKVSTSN